MTSFHAMGVREVLSELDSNEQGLTAAEAVARLERHGPNERLRLELIELLLKRDRKETAEAQGKQTTWGCSTSSPGESPI